MMKYLLIAILASVASPLLHAEESQRKLLSVWSTDCENIDDNRWFALESQGGDNYRFTVCAGFTCIPYPGFWEPFDVHDDERVNWASDTTIEVSNNDKDAGWEGYLIFNQCHVY